MGDYFHIPAKDYCSHSLAFNVIVKPEQTPKPTKDRVILSVWDVTGKHNYFMWKIGLNLDIIVTMKMVSGEFNC